MTPGILAPPFFVAAGILVVSGAAKLRRPRAAAQAMYAAGIRGGEAGARTLGAGAAPVGVGLVGIGCLAALVATGVPPAWNSYAAPPHEPGGGGRGAHRHQRADEALASAGIAVGHPSLWPGSRMSDSAEPVS